MTDKRPKRELPPSRFVTEAQVAARLGRGSEWFNLNKAQLERLGMPPRDNLIGLRDSKALEAWLDSRSGLDSNTGSEAAMLEAIRGDNNASLHQ